jgi:hypothetical protein
MTTVKKLDLAGLFKSRQKATQAAQELNREFAVHQGTKRGSNRDFVDSASSRISPESVCHRARDGGR